MAARPRWSFRPTARSSSAAGPNRPKSTASLPVIIRLNQSGGLDPGFGKGGYFWLSPPFGTKANGAVVSLALQPAGSAEKIVATGWSDYGPRFLLRLNANGAFDGSFNGTGYSLLNLPNVSAVRIQSVDGSPRIVVSGWTRDIQNHYLGAVWRFMDSGAPDMDFGGGTGLVQTSFHDDAAGNSLGDTFHSVAIDGANRIVAVGAKAYFLVPGDYSTTRNQLVLAKYDVSGNLDGSFGFGGKVWVPLSARGNDIGQRRRRARRLAHHRLGVHVRSLRGGLARGRRAAPQCRWFDRHVVRQRRVECGCHGSQVPA